MADTLKFGPEWLRALSHGNNVTSPPSSPGVTKYKLADYRYGREEMLVLYNKDLCQKPDILDEFSTITLDKCQLPLAFLPFTEEEQRNWSRSVNSDVVLRLAGRGSNPPGTAGPRTGGPMLSRGGSVDRGRGRGRGTFYSRNIAEEPGPDSLRDRDGTSRPGRNFDRSHSLHDRNQPWDDKERKFDKGYNTRGIDENGTLLSRKDNWRTEREEIEDDSGWRSTKPKNDKWNRTSWRNHADDRPNDYSQNSRHDGRPFAKGNRFHEFNNDRDQLPEWSKEDDFEWVGTFDSSGAFRENQHLQRGGEELSPQKLDKSDHEEKSVSPNVSREGSREEVKNGDVSPVQYTPVKKSQVPNRNAHAWDDRPPTDGELKSHSQKIASSSSSSLSSNGSSSSENNKKQTLETNSNQNTNQNMNSSVPKSDFTLESDIESLKSTNSHRTLPLVREKQPEANFDHLQKAAETMVEQWTAEEEEKTSPAQPKPAAKPRTPSLDNITALPLQHENALKWFYRDPQGEVQGPFASEEMSDWFNAGYFNMSLLIRRGCDDKFMQLGELMKLWGKCPFYPGQNVAPIKTPSAEKEPSEHLNENGIHPPSHEEQMRLFQQQLHPYQLLQQQLIQEQQQVFLRQEAQLRSLLEQREGFDLLNPQQQQHLLVKYLLAQQLQQRSAQSVPEGQGQMSHDSMQQLLSRLTSVHHPPAGMWPGTSRQAPSVWDMDSRSQSEPVQQNTAAIISNIEELQRREKERMAKEEREQEERRIAETECLRKAEEDKRMEIQRQEELRRKHEEEIMRQEEERRKNDELRRHEEERKRQEELRLKREEEERKEKEKEQLRRLEELRRKEELRKQEEMQELKRQQEMQRQEELRQEELRRLQELQRQEEERKRQEIEQQRELERIKELERQEEIENCKEMEREFEEKQRELLKFQEIQRSKMQTSAWGSSNSYSPTSAPSLAEIQKLQEEREMRERIERQKLMAQQQQQLAALHQQQQQMKSSLTWANSCQVKSHKSDIKSLAEIQKEEEAQVSKIQKEQAKQQKAVVNALPLNAAGVWGNASTQLTWNKIEIQDDMSSGFWDEPKKKASANKKSADPSFPTLGNQTKSNKKQNSQNNNNNNKTKSRSKKEEENVMKLFESKSTTKMDDFTQWCTKSLSTLNHSVDVPTFIGFLKDIESPFEVQDYVKSFLGDSKESKDFAKQFLERRSKQRNHVNTQQEENMWGPAPAIMPNQNKSSSHDGDGKTGSSSKQKKKKGRMQKLDSSVLGFTVHADPTRINVGEIDHGDVLLSK